ncbi:MAG: hypothetical protein JWN44_4324 [Myxococcales bacterium]|nr:hypothetical protein [Myxococcales bacterium]
MAEMTGAIVRKDALGPAERRAMYALFSRYYEQISAEQFAKDLDAKDFVILLFDEAQTIQGFSTIQHLEVTRGDKLHRGLFSGDTVVAEEFWGQRVLGRLFLRHLFAQKLKHPFEPYWWMLISKGYKTYLLMANNFAEHYPRYEAETPAAAQQVLDAFARTLFPMAYHRGSGLIELGHSLGQLKAGVAPISSEMLDNRRIGFFVERNPTWRRGTELACIARMTWTMPLYYGVKALWRQSTRIGGRLGAMLPSAASE